MTHGNTASDARGQRPPDVRIFGTQGIATACAVLVAAVIWLFFPEQPFWLALPAVLVAGAMECWLLARDPVPGPMARARKGGWLDRSSGLCSTAALSHFGDPMLRHALRRSEPLSLVLFDMPDLCEFQELYGHRAALHALRTVGAKLRKLTGSKGIAVRIGKHTFALLLPAASRQSAIDRLAAHFGPSAAFELEWEGDEIVLLPSVFICTAAREDTSAVALYTRCRKELDRWVKPRPNPRRNVTGSPAVAAGTAVSIGPLPKADNCGRQAPLAPTIPAPLR